MTWKLVPTTPTDEMYEAAYDLVEKRKGLWGWDKQVKSPGDLWTAMLSASPDPTTDKALMERVAEAIYGGDWNSLPEEAWLPNHGSIQDGKAQYRFMALAAIRAMENKS